MRNGHSLFEADHAHYGTGRVNVLMDWIYHQPRFEYEELFWDAGTSWAGHKWFAYDLVSNVKPLRIVELGTHTGTSFFSLCQAVKDGGLATEVNAVDTWKGDKHAGYYDESVWIGVNEILTRYYSGINANLLRMTFDEAAADFEEGSIDILHIDGLHTYEAVKHDFGVWFDKVSSGGIVLIHDTEVNEGDFGVYRFWDEVKSEFATMEFMHSFGLGVLCRNGELGNLVLANGRDWQMHYSNVHEMIRYSSIDSLQVAIDEQNKAFEQERELAGKNLERLTQDVRGLEQELVNTNLEHESELRGLEQERVNTSLEHESELRGQRVELLQRHDHLAIRCALPACFFRYYRKAFSLRPGRARINILEARIIAGSNLFDYSYYLDQYPGLDTHPLAHFIERGVYEGADPHPLFDTSFYLGKNPEIALSGMNPLAHYLEFGGTEGRDPHPLFDSSFYLESYPDVARAKMNPLVHYLYHGSAEGRVAHPLFDASYYLDVYPDVRNSGLDPLVHYILYGAAERRNPHPSFDASFYVENNPDVAETGINPLVHYIMYGAARGLETYPASRGGSHDLENIEDKALELEKHSPSPEPKRAPKWGRWRVIKCLLSFLKSTVSNSLPAAACGVDRN